MKGAYTIGIEEEYFLVDAATKTVTEERPEAFFAAVKAALGSQVSGEMLQSQIEVMTEPHHDMATARAEGRLWDIDTGHDLMITEPGKVADALLQVAEA